LPCRPVRGDDWPAHIGEALLPPAVGNPEGSLRDPLTTDPKGEVGRRAAKPQIYGAHNTPALTAVPSAYGGRQLDPWFVTGLTEGEGCFCVSLALRAKMKTGLEVRPSFSLSLNEKDLGLLEELRAYFECGWIRQSKADRTYKYEARSVGELVDHVMPHFESHPLRGSKAKSFAGFARVCRMIQQGDHLKREGLRTIVSVAYEMNLGKRRYPQEYLLRALSEVKG
jgi:LAGLIDADG DNA endonuclease family protein